MTPNSMTSFPVGGADIFVRCSGSGAALVCLHAGVADHRMYEAQHAALSDIARVVSFDRRGFGLTKTPDEPFAHADDLLEVANEYSADPAVFVGCSQGGRIAIDFALKHPARVAGLFLVAPVVSGMPEPNLPPDIKALVDEIDSAYEIEDLERINELELQVWLDGPTSASGRVTSPARELFTDMNRKALEHPELNQERQPVAAWDRVHEIVSPTRVYCGDLDFGYMKEIGQYLAASMPRAEYVNLPGMAHMPFLEAPEKMSGEIRQFLRSMSLS